MAMPTGQMSKLGTVTLVTSALSSRWPTSTRYLVICASTSTWSIDRLNATSAALAPVGIWRKNSSAELGKEPTQTQATGTDPMENHHIRWTRPLVVAMAGGLLRFRRGRYEGR